MSNFSTPIALTQPLKCTDLGIEMPERNLAITHIHDAEWWIWKHSGSQRKFEFTPSEVLDGLSDEELDALYAQRFHQLQLIYAPPTTMESPSRVGSHRGDSLEVSDSPQQEQQPAPAPSPVTPAPKAPKPLPHASPTHHKPDIDWDRLAPRIIEEVALRVAQEAARPVNRSKPSEIRIGNEGGLRVDLTLGCFHDFDGDVGGGVIELVMRELRLDKSAAVRWLERHGFLNESYTPSVNTPTIKPKKKHRSKSKRGGDSGDNEYYPWGLKLWRESKPIPQSFNHPARRWAADRNLLPLHLSFPNGIRYGEHTRKGGEKSPYIIALGCALDAWAKAYPSVPAPEPLKTSFQVLWLSTHWMQTGGGGKRKDEKKKYGTFQVPDDRAVLCLGDPAATEVRVCEGVADALAIYSRCPGAVVAALGKPSLGSLGKDRIIAYFASDGRVVEFYSDIDAIGEAKALATMIVDRGGTAGVKHNPPADDPADSAILDPFPFVNRTVFDAAVAVCREKGGAEPEREAWLSFVEGGDGTG